MAIKCNRKDCKFRDERGHCELGNIEINEDGVCQDYKKDEKKAIVGYNMRMGELLGQLGKTRH